MRVSLVSYDPPLKITIPVPSSFEKQRGIYSTGHRGGNLRVRCTNVEYDAIQAEAEILGISLGMFTRWCAIKTADALLRHRSEDSTSIEGEDIEPTSN